MSKKRDKLEEKYEQIIELISEEEVIAELEMNYGVKDIALLSVVELDQFLDYVVSENQLEADIEEFDYYNNKKKHKNNNHNNYYDDDEYDDD